MNAYIERVLEETKKKNANEPEFLQTVEEVLKSVEPLIDAHPEYEKACILERMVEPRLPRPVQRGPRPVQGRPSF